MKRIISILMCILLAFSSVGCGKKTDDKNDEKKASTSQAKNDKEKAQENEENKSTAPKGKMQSGSYEKLSAYIKENGQKGENDEYEVYRYASKTVFSMTLDKDGKIFWNFLFTDDKGSSFVTLELNKTSSLHNVSFIDVVDKESEATIASLAKVDALTYSKENYDLIDYTSMIEEYASSLKEVSKMTTSLMFTGAKSVLDDANITMAELGFIAYK